MQNQGAHESSAEAHESHVRTRVVEGKKMVYN